MQHLEKIIFGVVLFAAVALVIGHTGSGVNVTKPDFDADDLAARIQETKEPKSAAATVPAAEEALQGFIQTVEQPPRASRWSFYRRPTLKGIPKKKPDLRKILEAPGLTVLRTDFTAKLTWTDAETSTAKVTAYRIYRWVGDAKPDKTPVAELKPDVREWTDADTSVLKPDVAVHYAVTAMTGEETRHGKPESLPSEPVTVTFPYDRELVYYGSSWGAKEGKQAEVLVKVWHAGDWRGPVRFTPKSGEVIGKKSRVTIDGEQVEIDFTTKWTLKDAGKSSEKKVDDEGVERVVEEIWIVVTDPSGTETKLLAVEKPKTATGPRKPLDPVSKIIRELDEQRKAATAARDTDEARRLKDLRDWLSRSKSKYWNSARRKKRLEQLDKDIHNFGIDILDEQDKDRPKASKIKEIESRIEILKRIQAE